MKNKQKKLKAEQFRNFKKNNGKPCLQHVFKQFYLLGITAYKAFCFIPKRLSYTKLLLQLRGLLTARAPLFSIRDKGRLLTMLIVINYENRT